MSLIYESSAIYDYESIVSYSEYDYESYSEPPPNGGSLLILYECHIWVSYKIRSELSCERRY